MLNTSKGLTYAVVMKLVEGLEHKGHHLYCDNYYSSPALFNDLRQLGIGACGTVRLNRRGLPEKITSKSAMTKGDVRSKTEKGLHSMKWMDKQAVSMISTIHDSSMVSSQRRSKFADGGHESVQKPQCVVEYNSHMGGVDLSDQLVTYYNFAHRTVKWWRRVFFHLLETSIVNAYVMYTESTQSARRNLRTPAGGIAMIFTDWTWFILHVCYISCRILIRCVSSCCFHSNMVLLYIVSVRPKQFLCSRKSKSVVGTCT